MIRGSAVTEGRTGARAAHEHTFDGAVVLNRRADDALQAFGDDRAIVVMRDNRRGEVLVDSYSPSKCEDLASESVPALEYHILDLGEHMRTIANNDGIFIRSLGKPSTIETNLFR